MHLLKGENGNSFCIQSFANRADEVKVHDDGSFPERGVVLPRGARDRFELKVLTIRRKNQFLFSQKETVPLHYCEGGRNLVAVPFSRQFVHNRGRECCTRPRSCSIDVKKSTLSDLKK